jgi:hypothetical protein
MMDALGDQIHSEQAQGREHVELIVREVIREVSAAGDGKHNGGGNTTGGIE